MTDTEREVLIEKYRLKLIQSRDTLTKRIAAIRMKELIQSRSPEQVQKMEEARGLR